MNDLYIKWYTGHMEIHMDYFFPCDMQRFKKLLKVIELDWEHEAELKGILKVYLQERIPRLKDEVAEKQAKAAEYEQRMKKAQSVLKAEKAAYKKRGLMPDPCSETQDLVDINKDCMKQAKAEARKLSRAKGQFENYIKLL